MATLLAGTDVDLCLSPLDLISLKDAKVPAGAFAMRPLDQDHVESLLLSDANEWPAIIVTPCTAGYIVIDGYHRWEAATRAHLPQMNATCHYYPSETEVIEAAFRANLHHGLKASIESRGDYAYWLSVTYPDLVQAKIAERVGLSQGAVSKAIAKREEQARRAYQEQGKQGQEDEKTRKKRIKKSCRSFARNALQFLLDGEDMDDAELVQILHTVVKERDDLEKLARISRLLNTDISDISVSPAARIPRPLRLRQFAEQPIYGSKP